MSDIFCSICKSEGVEDFEFDNALGLVAHMNESHGEEAEKGETFDKDELLKSAEAPAVDKGYATEMYAGPYKDTGTERDEQGNIKKKKKKKESGYGLDPETGQPLTSAMGGKMKSEDADVDKARKDNDDDDVDEEDEKAMRYKKKAQKSIDAALEDEEEVVDISPFLKSLVEGIKEALGDMAETSWQQAGYVQGFNKSLAKNMIALHDEFLKEIETLKEELSEIGSSPVAIRKSALTPGDVQGRFGDNGGNGSKLNKSQIEALEQVSALDPTEVGEAMIDLVRKGELSDFDVVRYESTKEITPLVATKVVKALT